ncbi:glycosyltransferase family 2 protein [Mucilaginibacter agri]|uniref:Glycosyltransferase n=1 Tax=Mucilaginibacter agri TaxID=2695265 RepID=A0A965ZEV5_9SPHI|nr:glycosyltransferase family 2 protein [Mucilaginibacter agri]NCD68391.1 glycosyltransferase [Mucilaginibacter agri]
MDTVQPELLQALILTKNEEPNLKRVLDKLTWLDKVVVLDSFSTDGTLKIAAQYPNLQVHQRIFDTHANQWNYGLDLLETKWVLSLDSDYVLPEDFIAETKQIIATGEKAAYEAGFEFLVFGHRLKRNNTQPRPVLFTKADCRYFDDGHTQRLRINGETGSYKTLIWHDDRKALTRWLSNQSGYSLKECKMLLETDNSKLGLNSKLRKTKIFAPFLVFFYCLFAKGLIFKGWAGWHYTLQRTMVEMLLAIRLIEAEKLGETA